LLAADWPAAADTNALRPMQNDIEGPLSPDDLQPEARILVVADGTAKRSSLERLLREAGYEQLLSFAGPDLDQLASARADLVILDIGDGRSDDFQALAVERVAAGQREVAERSQRE